MKRIGLVLFVISLSSFATDATRVDRGKRSTVKPRAKQTAKTPAVSGGGFGSGASSLIKKSDKIDDGGVEDHSRAGTQGTGGDNAVRNTTP